MAKNYKRGGSGGSVFKKFIGLSPRMYAGLALGALAAAAIPAVGMNATRIVLHVKAMLGNEQAKAALKAGA